MKLAEEAHKRLKRPTMLSCQMTLDSEYPATDYRSFSATREESCACEESDSAMRWTDASCVLFLRWLCDGKMSFLCLMVCAAWFFLLAAALEACFYTPNPAGRAQIRPITCLDDPQLFGIDNFLLIR